jgi:hypothetical protein
MHIWETGVVAGLSSPQRCANTKPACPPKQKGNRMHREYWEQPRNLRIIKPRHAYQVGNRLFRTVQAAARFEAWRLILDKYLATLDGTARLSKVKSARGLICLCDLGYIGEDQPDYNDCPLHDRRTGYFARLHLRLSRNIERQYLLAVDHTAVSKLACEEKPR